MTKKRRWHRLAIPLTLAFAIIAGTVTVHEIAEPDTGDPAYLSPAAQQPASGDQLAELLRAKGITIRRETRSSDALTATWREKGGATLFIPAPEFVHPDYLWMLRQSPFGTRVVLVEPGARQVAEAVPPVGIAGKRWASAVTEPGPGCALTRAGRAAVTRTRYGGEGVHACYDHGLVSLEYRYVDFVIAGSADPFRADRLSEHDNATLAVDLLSTKRTLVWLDLHAMEPKPKTFSEDPPGEGAPIPSLQPGRERTRPDASPRPPSSAEPYDLEAGRADGVTPPDPFPPWLVPAILMLFLIALAIALAKGRRLGAPVPEPLPIDVPGAETALGRSRLYRRAKARGAALETLRIEARRRIAAALKLPNEREAILAALAGHDRAADILYGPYPETDDELHTLSRELLLLVEQVTREAP